MSKTLTKPLRVLLILATAWAGLSSCQTVTFYRQAMSGQMEIMRKSQPIGPLLANPSTSPRLRRQLESVQAIRAFASEQLALPAAGSYATYADLGRKHVSWMVCATPEFSLETKSWWYPFLGQLHYRGFFSAKDAEGFAADLRKQHYDVSVHGVDAYSTLGWFHDPVLNGFVDLPDIHLAELIFHELTHRKLFRKGDTAFNESLATTYSEEGVQRWLKSQGRMEDLRKYQQVLVRRGAFYQEIDHTRARLQALYASNQPPATMRQNKASIFRGLQEKFRSWGGHGLESWLNQDLNNADLVAVMTYQQNGPVFQKLLERSAGDPARFFKLAAHVKLPADGQPPAAAQ